MNDDNEDAGWLSDAYVLVIVAVITGWALAQWFA